MPGHCHHGIQRTAHDDDDGDDDDGNGDDDDDDDDDDGDDDGDDDDDDDGNGDDDDDDLYPSCGEGMQASTLRRFFGATPCLLTPSHAFVFCLSQVRIRFVSQRMGGIMQAGTHAIPHSLRCCFAALSRYLRSRVRTWSITYSAIAGPKTPANLVTCG